MTCTRSFKYYNSTSTSNIYQSFFTLSSAGAAVIRNHVDLVTEARKLEAENAHQWKQTKHLLKYIKNQEKDISRTEKLVDLKFKCDSQILYMYLFLYVYTVISTCTCTCDIYMYVYM